MSEKERGGEVESVRKTKRRGRGRDRGREGGKGRKRV